MYGANCKMRMEAGFKMKRESQGSAAYSKNIQYTNKRLGYLDTASEPICLCLGVTILGADG